MPSFIDYLLAPWKVISGLLGGGQAAPVAINGKSTSICYFQDAGGQVLHVCKLGNYEVPFFIFWSCILIFLLFMFISRKMIRECLVIEQSLGSVENAIRAIKKFEKINDEKSLAIIRNIIEKEKTLIQPWQRLEETLLISSDTGAVFSTSPIESVMTKETIVEDNLSISLYSALPGILTGLGLLMTFVAILDGLSHVTVSQNMDVQGIGGLINGLSGKFTSSIVAVSCAVAFVFIERFAYSRPTAAYRRLIRELSSRFTRRTMEQLLQEIQIQLAVRIPKGRTEATPRARTQDAGE